MNFVNTPIDQLHQLALSKRDEYARGLPFPHIQIDGLFHGEALERIIGEFPDLSRDSIRFRDANQTKRASRGEYRFGEDTRALMHFLNSQPFLEFLSKLTGIEALVPDPYFDGGGLHEIRPGGYLKIHADFNKHKLTQLDRRLNVLIYLNQDWEEAWGGHLELWDQNMQACAQRVAPLFNRMVVFTTNDFSYHGHPVPLRCPAGRSRKSLALYYYTNGRPESDLDADLGKHTTLFRSRPETDRLAWLQQTALTLSAQLTPPIVNGLVEKLRERVRGPRAG